MTNKKILMGDDNEEFLARFSRALKRPEIEVDTAITPEEVITKARQARYDKIVTDLDYTDGGAEGYKVLQEIRNLVPVRILYTARAEVEGVKEQAEQSEATHIISKQNISGLMRLLKEEK
ncbi:MAG: response regulator [Candidatus Pacearchaeota archaeon]|nr:response regulator [Candidatus Pacearchaeota archaeon]